MYQDIHGIAQKLIFAVKKIKICVQFLLTSTYAIYYIENNQLKLRISELNEALAWAGKNSRAFRGKDRKIGNY